MAYSLSPAERPYQRIARWRHAIQEAIRSCGRSNRRGSPVEPPVEKEVSFPASRERICCGSAVRRPFALTAAAPDRLDPERQTAAARLVASDFACRGHAHGHTSTDTAAWS